jgi:uncharacterized protein affecting Mg2+/Co2+ transport
LLTGKASFFLLLFFFLFFSLQKHASLSLNLFLLLRFIYPTTKTNRIKITNETVDKTFQLLSRAWEIVDGGDGTERNPERTERVRGPGVVGETPVLDPGKSFSYSSFAQLRTPAGSMRGTYTFVEVEQEKEEEEEENDGGGEEEERERGKKSPPLRQQQQRGRATRNPLATPKGPEFDVVIGQFGLDERDSRPPEPGTM